MRIVNIKIFVDLVPKNISNWKINVLHVLYVEIG